MLQSLGEVVEEHNGNTRVVRNGQTLVIHQAAISSVMDPASIMKVRHFLRSSRADEASEGNHLLVVIDHQEARIYKSDMHGTEPIKIVPFDPHGFGRHVHSGHDSTKGQHHHVPKSYYEAVAKTCSGASHILIFGNGTGGASAMGELMDYLHDNEKMLFEHVMGALSVDEQHLTEDELLAKSRDFYGPNSSAVA